MPKPTSFKGKWQVTSVLSIGLCSLLPTTASSNTLESTAAQRASAGTGDAKDVLVDAAPISRLKKPLQQLKPLSRHKVVGTWR